MAMLKIAHIINVTEINESSKKSYLHIAQPVTIKSMIVAQNMAQGLVDVELFAVKHQSESVTLPSEFRQTSDMGKYAYEYIESLKDVTPHRPLPRLTDIISSLYEASDADYFIYTNLDIGLYPHFYIEVGNIIQNGFDAFCINRRDLRKAYEGVLLDENKLELAYISEGAEHPGIDCFVFRREIVQSFNLGDVYIGFPPVGQVLKTAIEVNSKNFVWIKDRQLTFHLGSDKRWRALKGDYASENFNQAEGLFIPCLKDKKRNPLPNKSVRNKLNAGLTTLINIFQR